MGLPHPRQVFKSFLLGFNVSHFPVPLGIDSIVVFWRFVIRGGESKTLSVNSVNSFTAISNG